MVNLKIFICLCIQLFAFSTQNISGFNESQHISLQVFNNHVLIDQIIINEDITFKVVNIGEYFLVTDTSFYRSRNLIDKNNRNGLIITNGMDDTSIDFPLKPVIISPGDSLSIKLKSTNHQEMKFLIINFVYMITTKKDFSSLYKDEFLMNSNKLGLRVDL